MRYVFTPRDTGLKTKSYGCSESGGRRFPPAILESVWRAKASKARQQAGEGIRIIVSAEQKKRRAPAAKPKETGRYANLFQIGYNAFEMLIEFGQQEGGMHTRIYVSPQHARILCDLLQESLRRHDATFGTAKVKP